MSKIKLTESQLSNVIKETLSRLKESTRDDLYKSQIEKEFPRALNNYDGKMPYDQYYLELTNNKKEQDKLQRRTDSKNKTSDRNAQYKAEYGERDKEIRKQNINAKKLEVIDDFVDYLPDNFPYLVDTAMEKTWQGKDGAFYFIIGRLISDFSRLYFSEDEKKGADYLTKLINHNDYEDYFLDKVVDKFGYEIEF